MANILLRKAAKDKLAVVSLSNDVVKGRINDISEDILNQVVADFQASQTKFNLQLNETTGAANLNQLIAFVRYVKGHEIKKRVSLLQTPHNNC